MIEIGAGRRLSARLGYGVRLSEQRYTVGAAQPAEAPAILDLWQGRMQRLPTESKDVHRLLAVTPGVRGSAVFLRCAASARSTVARRATADQTHAGSVATTNRRPIRTRPS